LETITAAGGAVYQEVGGSVQLLLIYRNGVWDLPKGKLEKNESVKECAAREVAEEVGVSHLPNIESKLTNTTHYYTLNSTKVRKDTHWYVMQFGNFESEFSPQKEEGITKVEWHDIENAKTMVGYDNLKLVIAEVEKWLQTH